jgi:UDP-glucose 4-epimerase
LKVLVTGSAGFIAGYLVDELLRSGHEVVGVDNFSKYGEVRHSYDSDPKYHFVKGDAKDVTLLKELVADCDTMIAAAAKIGGIRYFHELAYDLIAENERIVAAQFDAAIWARRERKLNRVLVISSSMVFESADVFPTREGMQLTSPPPLSTYGFQKLSCEYFAKGAWEQYKLPFTICRPFNCVGIGEGRAAFNGSARAGNAALAMSHVLPDIVLKVLKGQDPLHILGSGRQIRHYTYGGDLARGIRLCMESDRAVNEDFNLSTPVGHTVLELAELVWTRFRPGAPFRYACDAPFEYDVQKRVPDVEKARRILGFEANTPLEKVLDEVIPWIQEQVRQGLM